MTLQLILYVRANDPASAQARQWSDALQTEYPHTLELRDVDANPAWKQAAGAILPAAEVNGRRIGPQLSKAELASALALARAIGQYQQETNVPRPVQAVSGAADRAAGWLSRHWLAAFNGFVGAFLGLSFLAPILMKIGATVPARWIYTVYSATCHQLAFRSFFFFGEQPDYPRAIFQASTGIDPNDIWASRAFIGGGLFGYKIALCERCVAIYGAILITGLIYAFLRNRIKVKPLHWALWILVGIIPIGLDGGSQLLSYLPFFNFPARESTPLLRVITGALFGITSVWFAYPYMQESMEEEFAGPSPRKP
jgi:uncharacterized membrane protein